MNAPATPPRILRLLFVDDDAVTLGAFSRLMRRAGHEITTAASLAEARAVATANLDFVICDLGLPDGSGLELMPELRDRHGLRGIALSGYSGEEDLRQAREAGFVDYLVKPVDIQDVLRAIERAG